MISILALVPRGFPRLGIWIASVVVLAAGETAAADVHRGRALYSAHCSICHGDAGAPVMPGAPNFRRMESLMRPDMQLMTSIRNGKGAMPGYFGILRERDILDVIAHLRTLS